MYSDDIDESLNIQYNYNFEDVRLASFDNWPVPFISKNALAKTGFYFLQDGDRVKCNFCKIIVQRWENGDDPIEEHMKWSPSCPLLKRRNTQNVPLKDLNNTVSLSEVCIHYSNEKNDLQIKYPEYQNEINRVHSFRDWPPSLRPKRDDFNNSGLFYTGNGDRVVCFSCGLGLKDWETGDEPFTEHARWTPGCRYLEHIKGIKFIQDVKKSFKKPEAMEVDNEEPLDTKICAVCLVKEKEFVFIPCGHLVACGTCSAVLYNCPICRARIERKQKVYNA